MAAARRTRQADPLGCDERQGFQRAVLLDPPSAQSDTPPAGNLYYPDLDALCPGAISPATGAVMDTPRIRPRGPTAGRPAFEPIVTVEIDAVTPSDRGFTLTAQGAPPDRAEYRLHIHFELPLDPRTRTVLGELLSQSDLTISRRPPP